MIAACAAGLWAVLAYGNRLQAPEDLAGKWTLAPLSPNSSRTQTGTYGPTMTIDQSGQFFQVSFENGPHLDLRLHESQVLMMQGNPVVFMKLSDDRGWNVRAWGAPGGDVWRVFVNRPLDGQSAIGSQSAGQDEWIANRIARTYPAHVAAKAGGH
jgi:hypothetical protein